MSQTYLEFQAVLQLFDIYYLSYEFNWNRQTFLLVDQAHKCLFLVVWLKSSLHKFYDRHNDLIVRYGISVSQMTTNMFRLS